VSSSSRSHGRHGRRHGPRFPSSSGSSRHGEAVGSHVGPDYFDFSLFLSLLSSFIIQLRLNVAAVIMG